MLRRPYESRRSRDCSNGVTRLERLNLSPSRISASGTLILPLYSYVSSLPSLSYVNSRDLLVFPLLSQDNAVEQPGGIKFGRDVYLWGHNLYYQLGSGKRSNLSTPQHLAPLPYPGLAAAVVPPVDATVESGTTSPMPHSRLQLAPEIKYDGKKVEEAIVAGDGASGTYWRILSP